MKNYARAQFCETQADVVNAVEKFRQTLTPQKCQNYLRKLHEVKIYF